jgi:hypothetical protein
MTWQVANTTIGLAADELDNEPTPPTRNELPPLHGPCQLTQSMPAVITAESVHYILDRDKSQVNTGSDSKSIHDWEKYFPLASPLTQGARQDLPVLRSGSLAGGREGNLRAF